MLVFALKNKIFKKLNNSSAVYVSLGFLPVLLEAILSKAIRHDRTGMGLADHLMLFGPELLFYGFCALVCWLMVALYDQMFHRLNALPRILVFFVALNFLALDILGHNYIKNMGSSDFDYLLVVHTVAAFDQLWPIIRDAVNFGELMAIGVLVSLYMLGMVALAVKAPHQHAQVWPLAFMAGASLLLALFVYGEAEAEHSFPPLPEHKFTLRKSPLPLALQSISRTFFVNTFSLDQSVEPIRPIESAPEKLTWREGARQSGPNVVLVMLESTGYKYTVGNEFGHEVSPYLSKLAWQGRSYSQAYTFIPHTSKSIESILCGYEPTLGLEIVSGKQDAALADACWPQLLEQVGYHTAYFSPVREDFEYRRQFIENVGFDEAILMEELEPTDFDRTGWLGYEEDILLKPIDKWLEARGAEPFFMSLLTLTPHYPYVVPKGHEIKKWADDPLLNGHLNGLNYQDKFIEKLVDVFAAKGLLKNTILVFVGDHGEAFGEHGVTIHNTVPYNETLLVPFVIWNPELIERQAVREPVSLMDVMPTVLSSIGLDFDKIQHRYTGRDVSVGLGDRPIYSYCYSPRYCASVVHGRWKYIEYFHPDQQNELYDLILDPGEKNNVVEQFPEKETVLKKELLLYLARVDKYHRQYFQRFTASAH